MVFTEISTYQAEASPVLLNLGDTVDARFIIVADESVDDLGQFEIDGRISGVEQIGVERNPKSVAQSRIYIDSIVNSIFSILVSMIIILFPAMWFSRRKSRLEMEKIELKIEDGVAKLKGAQREIEVRCEEMEKKGKIMESYTRTISKSTELIKELADYVELSPRHKSTLTSSRASTSEDGEELETDNDTKPSDELHSGS